MKRNVLILLVFLLLGMYVWMVYPDGGFRSLADYFHFVSFAEKVVLFIGMSILIILTMSSASQDEIGRPPAQVWFSGLLAVLGAATVFVMMSNPFGTFPWNVDEHVGTINPRVDKIAIYRQRTSVPDVVFMGTSVSFRIPAQEYAQRFSFSGFNFSVNGATPVDYFTLTNLILSKASPDNKPKIIVAEILAPNLTSEHAGMQFYKGFPFEGAAYAPFPFSLRIVSSQLNRVFDIVSFSSAVFVEYFVRQGQQPTIYFGADGTILRPFQGPSTGYDQARFAETSTLLDQFLFCTELDKQGKDLITRTVALAKKHGVKLMFYRPPINDDFYKKSENGSKTYKRKTYRRCGNQFDQFMQEIQSDYPNVVYVNLSNYRPISSGGTTYYLDADHLTAEGMDRLLEVLTPIIKEQIE